MVGLLGGGPAGVSHKIRSFLLPRAGAGGVGRDCLPTCCSPMTCGRTPCPAGKVTKVGGSFGHRPGHWLSGRSRPCPLTAVPVMRCDFYGPHLLPLTAGDSLPRPPNCSTFGDPQCPDLRGGSARHESSREPAGMEGDPEAMGPEPSFLLNFLPGETCVGFGGSRLWFPLGVRCGGRVRRVFQRRLGHPVRSRPGGRGAAGGRPRGASLRPFPVGA